MSGTNRQDNLFAGQDWTVIYRSMSQVNFNAYDFDTIKAALVSYIQTNYPESFNDWSENSEFVAIIEMLAYLGSSLAFRVDLNIREAFLDTATRRESILRLARMLSYSPRRCLPGQGLLKLNKVLTDQEIYDSNGVNLANTPITWQDANNPDWYEQFILVLNAAFISSNPFGQPVKNGTVGNVPVQRYDFNNTLTSVLAFPFNALVNGNSTNFEFCNTDFTTQTIGSISVGASGYYQEKDPSIFNPISLVYRNDGNGNASPNTGFFILFKQGTFGFTDYILSTPVPNRVIDVAAININQNDVWVETVDDRGITLTTWTKVPAIASSNLVYNNVNRLTRNIFQVVTTDNNGNDSISIRFGDGNFGNIPTGRIRVYYRTSNNLTYTIQPVDMTNIGLAFGYVSSTNVVNNVQLNFSLQTPVANSLGRESATSIQTRAPATYYSQNRMVNGEDYNVFPLRSSSAMKVKAVNRVYSGQSRGIDINDPTSTYQTTKIFSDDGIISQQDAGTYTEIPAALNLNGTQIINQYLQPLLRGKDPNKNVNVAIRDFYLENYPSINSENIGSVIPTGSWPANFVWQNSSSGNYSNNTSAGQFQYTTNGLVLPLPDNGSSSFGFGTQLRKYSMVQWTDGNWSYVIDDGTSSSSNYNVVISGIVSSGTGVVAVVPSFNSTFSTAESSLIAAAINSKSSFGITYYQQPQISGADYINWVVINKNNLAVDADFSLENQGNGSNAYLDTSWIFQFKWANGIGWQIKSRGLKTVFESVKDVRFYNTGTMPFVDPSTGMLVQDNIKILKYNGNSSGSGFLPDDLTWTLRAPEVLSDGHIDSARVLLNLHETSSDGIPDNPKQFDLIVKQNPRILTDGTGLVTNPESIYRVFWSTPQNSQGPAPFKPTRIIDTLAHFSSNWGLSNTVWKDGDIAWVMNPGIFFKYQASPQAFIDVSSFYYAAAGRSNLFYSWYHVADSSKRIDPAIMNIIDVYILTSSYDTAIRNWISNGNSSTTMPVAPSPEDLRMAFQDFENYKMMTDQIVWHPVSYKILFGAMADPSLQVVFKVVKNTNVGITDSEIKSQIIQTINNYFSIGNWDFGQSFFFTELAAYIHQQLLGYLSSVVIVPLNANSTFGSLFEITCNPDEIFISSARVTDIQIVQSLSPSILRQS